MDQALQELSIDCIFSAPYHSQSNWKLEVVHKYLKPTLKKLCEKDPAKWDRYINQAVTSYTVTPILATAETPFFLVYGRDPNLSLHQLLDPMQQFLGDQESGLLHLEANQLTLAIANKTLDGNCFMTAQKNRDREPPSFTLVRESILKQTARKMGSQVETLIKDYSYWAQQTLPTHWKSGHMEDKVMQHQGYRTWTPVEFWNIDIQFCRARKYINHLANLPTIILNNWRWTPYSCKLSPVNNLHSSSLQYSVFKLHSLMQQSSGRARRLYYSIQYWKPTPPTIPGSSQLTYL